METQNGSHSGRNRLEAIPFCIKNIVIIRPYTEEEAQEIWDSGGKVPLDLAPPSYWRLPNGQLRWGEEVLSENF